MMRRVVVAALGLLVVVFAVAACGSSSSSSGSGSSGSTIKLGSTNVLTGAIAAVCKPITDGASAWFDSVNADGGVNGKRIDYTVLDDQYDPARAAANARRLADDGNTALVAGCGTANEQAAQRIARTRSMPLIGAFSNLPDALTPANDSYFATFPIYGVQDAASIDFALRKYGPGSVVHISQNIPGIEEEDAIARAATERAGGRWLGSVYTDPTTTDYTPTALRVKSMHPDYILFSGGSAQTAQIISAFKAQNVFPAKRFLASTSSTDATLLRAAGDVLDGRFLGVSSVEETGPNTRSCIDAMKKYAPSTDMGLHGLYGCSVAQVVTAALRNASGDVDATSLATALNAMREDTSAPAFGPVTFTPSDHSGVKVGTAYEVDGGRFVKVGEAPFVQP
jgi:branched-chain amino acid transport system substrate-binding protein